LGDSVLIHPRDIKGNRIYPTEASHHVQKRLKLSKVDVKTKLYLDAILFERPIIQLSHMLSSYKTSSIFEENPDLLSEKIFSMATSKKTFADYRHYAVTEKYETKRRELAKLGISYSKAKHFELEFFADVKEMPTSMRRDHVNQMINLIRDKSAELVFFNPQEAVDLFKETLVKNNLISKKSLKPETKKAPLKKGILRGATLGISLLPEPISKASDFLKDYVDEKYPVEPLRMFATQLSNEVMKSRIKEYSMKTSRSIRIN
jgi:hypothetical protein